MNWHQYNRDVKRRKDENLQDSMDVVVEARNLAREYDLSLEQHSPWHFSLTRYQNGQRKWRLNLYPSNQRIWQDQKCGKAPYLKLNGRWNLLDIVEKCKECA